MQTFAHYALPAAIVASALGAVVFCIVLLLYGFATVADDEPRFPSRRLFVIRIGHALAATCFAAVVILPESGTPRSSDEDALEARINVLEQRLEAAEKRSGDVRDQPATVESWMTPTAPAVRRAVTPRRPAPADRPRRSAEEVATLPPRGAGESPIGGAALGSASPPSP